MLALLPQSRGRMIALYCACSLRSMSVGLESHLQGLEAVSYPTLSY